MNRIVLFFLFLALCGTASSQKVYFIYLQSEAEQPFYVKMNNKVLSSSTSGYLILSRLHDSTYNFSIGFPTGKWPEQKFTVAINKKDHGYLLKNFKEKGWGLFDLQTLTVQMPVAGSARTEIPAGQENKEVSLFTAVLSKAADDPSLKDKPIMFAVEKKVVVPVTEIARNEEPKKEKKEAPAVTPKETQLVQKKEEITAPPKDVAKAIQTPEKVEPQSTKQEEKKDVAQITKVPEKVESTIGKEEEKKDVAQVTRIPEKAEPQVAKQEEKKEVALTKTPEKVNETPVTQVEVKVPRDPETEVKKGSASLTTKDETEEYKRSIVKRRSESSTTEGFGLVFIDEVGEGAVDTIRLMIPNPKPIVAPKKEEPKEEKRFLELPVADSIAKSLGAGEKTGRNTCAVIAGESDFFQVRKVMTAEEKDDDMIAAAQKYFKTKCFTTQQVKNLGALFLNDAARYKFFDMTYPYIVDTANFISLESELKDSYYLGQFKAIVKQ